MWDYIIWPCSMRETEELNMEWTEKNVKRVVDNIKDVMYFYWAIIPCDDRTGTTTHYRPGPSCGVGASVLFFKTRRWSVVIYARPLYLRERDHHVHSIGSWVGPRAVLDALAKGKLFAWAKNWTQSSRISQKVIGLNFKSLSWLKCGGNVGLFWVKRIYLCSLSFVLTLLTQMILQIKSVFLSL